MGDVTLRKGAEERCSAATAEEREVLRRMGERVASAALRMPRSTLARIASGFAVREGTLVLFRVRLAELTANTEARRAR